MTETETPTARERAIFALLVLGNHLRSDVLNDGDIVARYAFDASRPIQIGERSASRDALFHIFRRLADGEPGPLSLTLEGPEATTADVSLAGDTAIVILAGRRHTFDHAAMLSASSKRRVAVLEAAFDERPLCRAEQDALRERVRDSAFGGDEFLEVMISLAASPGAFIDALEEASKKGALSKEELLPDDARYWDNLVGRWQASVTIEDYLAAELAFERAEQFRGALGPALGTISVTFATPMLIPKDLLKSKSREERLEGLTWLADATDPFALTGVLQFCAEHHDDPGISELGARVLRSLFADMQRLETWAQVFAAVFVLSTAALAENEELSRRPPFWRRLAAHGHACLVLRASGGLKGNQEEFISWAMSNSGALFLASILRDFVTEPRWRPDWLTSTFVIADIVGRVQSIVNAMTHAPEPWTTELNKVKEWLTERHAGAAAFFPAPGEGARKPPPTLHDLGALGELYRTFMTQPTTENFVRLTTLVHAFVPPRDIEAAAIEVVRALLRPGTADETQYNWMALALGGHISMLWQSNALAAAVAETTIALVRRGEDINATDALTRLMECNAALADRTDAATSLSSHLEALSFALKSQRQLSHVSDIISALRRFDPTLAPALGRAAAVAALGSKRAGTLA